MHDGIVRRRCRRSRLGTLATVGRNLRHDSGRNNDPAPVRATAAGACSGTIEAPFVALLPLVCSAQGLLSGRAVDEETKTCTRCGGAVRTLRRFTRSGSAVSVLVCQVCRYTVFVAGSRAASSPPPTPTSRAD